MGKQIISLFEFAGLILRQLSSSWNISNLDNRFMLLLCE